MLALEQITHAQSPKLFLQRAAPVSSHEEHRLGRDKTRKDDSGMLPTYCRMPVALSIWKVVYLQSSSEYTGVPVQAELLH